MPEYKTSSGWVGVGNWGYQLQQPGGLDAGDLAAFSHDMIVMDFSRYGAGDEAFSATGIARIKDGDGGRSLAVSYLSIGEASEFRDHWDAGWTVNGRADGHLTPDAPDWLGPTNPDWPESRKVRYWDDDWQNVIFNDAGTGWLDRIVSQGFDAAYLDIVDAYYYWAAEAPKAARQPGDPAPGDEKDAAIRMIDFIVDMTAHARETNPEFFTILQNGAFILDALEGGHTGREAALLDAIGGIAVEDTYFRGSKAENNAFKPDHDTIKALRHDFLFNDVPVFAVDYLSSKAKQTRFEQEAISDGFIPHAAPDRDLGKMGKPMGADAPTKNNDYLTGGFKKDKLKGQKGDDIIDGLSGRDVVKGQAGGDWLYGGRGPDKLFGGQGADVLRPGQGRDTLAGGAGRDKFVFAEDDGRNETRDFEDGRDKLVLSAFSFKSKAQALGQFYEAGGKGNDVVKFDDAGTSITIRGIDLKDLKGADIII